MKKPSSLLASLLLVPLSVAVGSGGERVDYSPEEGTTLSKKVEIESNVSLEEISATMDGQDMSSMIGSMEMTLQTTQTVAVNDRYVSVGDGRPARLERTFDEISSKTHVSMSNPMAGEMDTDMPGSSELEGLSVVFTWNEDEGDYDVAFAEGTEGDEELLEDLAENMDLREFLPEAEVAVGDTWEIPADAARAAMAPGGSLKIVPEEQDDSMSGMGLDNMSQDEMLGELAGEIVAEFTGIREEGEKKVAAIKLKFDVSSANDLSEKMSEMQSEMPEGMPKMEVQSFDVELEFEGEGELLWNLDQGLFHSLNISGDVGMVMDIAMSFEIEGDSKSIEQTMNFKGTQSITMTAGE
jgi:hypothetical protein